MLISVCTLSGMSNGMTQLLVLDHTKVISYTSHTGYADIKKRIFDQLNEVKLQSIRDVS